MQKVKYLIQVFENENSFTFSDVDTHIYESIQFSNILYHFQTDKRDPIEVEQINFAHPVHCLTQLVYEQNLIDIGFNRGRGGGNIEWNFSEKMSDGETRSGWKATLFLPCGNFKFKS